jgi:hypothetical protein
MKKFSMDGVAQGATQAADKVGSMFDGLVGKLPDKMPLKRLIALFVLAVVPAGILLFLAGALERGALLVGLSLLVVGLYHPRWIAALLWKEHPFWFRLVVGVVSFGGLTVLIQEGDIRFSYVLLGILGVLFVALMLRTRLPAVGAWLTLWALPLTMVLLLAPPLITLRVVEFEVRGTSFHDSGRLMVTTNFGSHDGGAGETFWNERFPLLGKMTTGGIEGIMKENGGKKVRAVVTGIGIEFKEWNRQLLWAAPIEKAPVFPTGMGILIGSYLFTTMVVMVVVFAITRKRVRFSWKTGFSYQRTDRGEPNLRLVA